MSGYYVEIQPVALTVLGDIGQAAHEAIGTLEKLIHDPNPAVVKLASEALVKIGNTIRRSGNRFGIGV